MAALTCSRAPTMLSMGTVDIHNSGLVEELIIDRDGHIQTTWVTRQKAEDRRCRTKRPHSTPHSIMRPDAPSGRRVQNQLGRPATTMDADTLIGHTLKLQDWLNEKQVKTLQEKADLEAKNTRKLYTDVLDTENTFVKELEGLVARKEQLALRKKELLHKKWSESVYEPIRKQIDTQMHGPAYTDLVRRKRQQHKEYLEHVNRKGHVFLDTIAPDEYYAMSIHPTRPSAITAQTKPLKDPLLAQERDRTEEDRVIYQCTTGSALSENQLRALRLPRLPLVPLGRHGTECHTWLEMPMGDIESPVRMASRIKIIRRVQRQREEQQLERTRGGMTPESIHRFKSTTNDSQIDFPRWAKLQFRSNFIDEELKIQRKRMYSQDLPNDRTRSNPTVTNNCGGPDIPKELASRSAPA